MHSLMHDIPPFFILFLEELFLIFNRMLSIRAFGRCVLWIMELPIKFDIVKSRWYIDYIEDSQAIIPPPQMYFLFWRSILPLQTLQTLVECHFMRQFIWVFIICQSTYLRVPGLQRVLFKNSEYDQEIPQSQTADNPVASRGRAAQPSRDTRKTN